MPGRYTERRVTKPTLADSLGKGLNAPFPAMKLPGGAIKLGFGHVDVSCYTDSVQWAAVRQALDNSSEKGDVATFEATFERELRRTEKQLSASDTKLLQAATFASFVSAQLIDYTMCKIFRCDELGCVSVKFQCNKVIASLLSYGLLSKTRLERSLTLELGSTRTPYIAPASVSQALMQVDPHLKLLDQYIYLCGSGDTTELIATIKLLIEPDTEWRGAQRTHDDAGLGVIRTGE